MSFVTLINEEKLSFSTDQLIIPAQNVALFNDVLDANKNLTKILYEFEQRVEDAEKKGFEAGFEKGRQDGMDFSRREIAEQLTSIAIRSQRQQQSMKDSIVKLAMQIVRRIADNFGAQEVVATLAKKAVEDLVASDFLVLYVHPSVIDKVKARLNCGLLNEIKGSVENNKVETSYSSSNKIPYVDIRTDDDLSPFDCQINTEFGTTIAGLDYQLECLTELIQENITSKQGANYSSENNSMSTPPTKMDVVE